MIDEAFTRALVETARRMPSESRRMMRLALREQFEDGREDRPAVARWWMAHSALLAAVEAEAMRETVELDIAFDLPAVEPHTGD